MTHTKTYHTPWHHLSATIMTLMLSLVFTGCGKEDGLTPDYKNPSDYFQPSTDDNSEEAQLRRQFYAESGSYLIFNDTIQRNYTGTDINGNPSYFVETVDLTYSVGLSAYISTHYSYTYLETLEQKQQTTDFLRTYILPHFTGKLRPYCWFVCNVISTWNDNNSTISKPYAASNQRCIAVAANYLVQRERSDAQKKNYAQRILNAVIGQLAMNHSEDFTDFYTYSSDYYGRDYISMGYEDKPSTQELYTLGFLSSTASATFPSSTTDLNSYALLVIQNSEEQLNQRFANYPIVLQKASVVREVLTQLGYVIEI